MAECLRQLHASMDARMKGLEEYRNVIERFIDVNDKYVVVVNENSRLKQIMYHAPALTAAAEAGMETVEQVEHCWTHLASERVQ
jgi:flagellar motility protein MotE (MotC chaperone)